jgi:hypothetical protein
MIYNIIVDSQPDPTGGWSQIIKVELHTDQNPPLAPIFGEGVMLLFVMEGDDWSIPAIDADVRGRLQEDLEELQLARAREISVELQG